MTNLKDLKVLLIDCQTTGMRPSSGDLLELAWSATSAGEDRPAIHSSLIRLPEGESVPYRVTEITGIRDEDLENGLEVENVFQKFQASVSELPLGAPAVIHYAQFEKPFLLDMFSKFEGKEELPFEVICSHSLLKRLFPNLPSQNIRGAAGFFGDTIGQVKRGESHILATHQIWKGLVAKLAEDGIETLEALRVLIATKKESKKVRYDYRINRAKRLELPDEPGIYRMLSKSGEVLYVGKATSLKSRVNSYFRGQRGRDRRKLEMLAQVWDLNVTSCKTALEAALMEADEIKRFNPPYNVMMKRGRRHLVFYSKDFLSVSRTQDDHHPIGPFKSQNWMEHLRMLERSLKSGNFEQIFYLPVPEEILKAGFDLFLSLHGLDPNIEWNVRRFLAYGLNLYRHYEEPEEDVETEEDSEPRDPTPEEIAGKFDRLMRRSGAEYWRAREMTHLLNARVEFTAKGETRRFQFTHGQIDGSKPEDITHPWQGLDVDTYDRLSVLLSELAKYEHRIERDS